MKLSDEERERYKLLEKTFLEKLISMSDKMVRKNLKCPHVLSALQVASLDFLGSVVIANMRMLVDRKDNTEASTSLKLDYVEQVRDLANCMFEQIKTSIKSVELH